MSGLMMSDAHDWEALAEQVRQYGTRNIMITAVCPKEPPPKLIENIPCGVEPFFSANADTEIPQYHGKMTFRWEIDPTLKALHEEFLLRLKLNENKIDTESLKGLYYARIRKSN